MIRYTLNDDPVVHAASPTDIRYSLCGIWVGDGAWHSTENPVDCPKCSTHPLVLGSAEIPARSSGFRL